MEEIKVFISYSSTDKEFARRLTLSLEQYQIKCWIDERDIKVGDYILNKIEDGLLSAHFLILILSKKSVASNWVRTEWVQKFWDEVESQETLILPILIEDCEIPKILRDKKYADFRSGFEKGFFELLSSIIPTGKYYLTDLDIIVLKEIADRPLMWIVDRWSAGNYYYDRNQPHDGNFMEQGSIDSLKVNSVKKILKQSILKSSHKDFPGGQDHRIEITALGKQILSNQGITE